MRTRRTGSIAGTDISAVFEDDDIAEQFSVDGSLDFSVQEPLTSKATVTEEHPSLVHELGIDAEMSSTAPSPTTCPTCGGSVEQDSRISDQNTPLRLRDADYVEDHSISWKMFGKQLVDYGYKRLFTISARRFARRFTTWHHNRAIDTERAKKIADDLFQKFREARSQNRSLGIMGNICLFFFEHKAAQGECDEETCHGFAAVFDGQHRQVAIQHLLTRLQTEGYHDADFDVTLEVYPVRSKDDIWELFRQINSAEPVQLVDMLKMDPQFKEWIDKGCKAFLDRFQACSSVSSRCRSPNFNVDVFRNAVFNSPIMQAYSIKSELELYAFLEAANEYYHADGGRQCKASAQATSKAVRHGFFLGLTSEWLENPTKIVTVETFREYRRKVTSEFADRMRGIGGKENKLVETMGKRKMPLIDECAGHYRKALRPRNR